MKHSVILGIVLGIVRSCWAQAPEVTFRAEARLVEVYATVLDPKGRYMDGLQKTSFRVTDNGVPQRLLRFENTSGDFSCAIVLDTTGSMTKSFPIVRNAISRLIDELRERDWLAIYGFNTGLELLHDFSRDRADAKRALLRTRAAA